MLKLILEYNRKLLKQNFTHDAFIQSILIKKKSVLIQIGINAAVACLPNMELHLGRCCPRVVEARIISYMIIV